jgi:hypothetical protein
MPIVIGIVVLAVVGISAGFLLSNNEDESATTSTEVVREETVESTDTTNSEPAEEQASDVQSTPEARVEDVVTEEVPAVVEEAAAANIFANGTYNADSFYLTPRRTRHDMTITLEVVDDVVVDANVTYDGGTAQTPNHARFDEAYRAEVVGQRLDEVSLSRTGGASLTSDAFNDAVETIKADAAV